MVLIPLLSPQGWDYVLLLDAGGGAADRSLERPDAGMAALAALFGVMGLAIYDVLGRELWTVMALSIVSARALGVVARSRTCA